MFYAVEIKRTSYITIHVEADNHEQAEELAWETLEGGYEPLSDANWECTAIVQQPTS